MKACLFLRIYILVKYYRESLSLYVLRRYRKTSNIDISENLFRYILYMYKKTPCYIFHTLALCKKKKKTMFEIKL